MKKQVVLAHDAKEPGRSLIQRGTLNRPPATGKHLEQTRFASALGSTQNSLISVHASHLESEGQTEVWSLPAVDPRGLVGLKTPKFRFGNERRFESEARLPVRKNGLEKSVRWIHREDAYDLGVSAADEFGLVVIEARSGFATVRVAEGTALGPTGGRQVALRGLRHVSADGYAEKCARAS